MTEAFRESDPLRRQTILVVDDEPDILESLCAVLSDALDVDTLQATSGEEGLERLAEGRVDLILTDYKMPGMNGLDFLRAARQRAPRTPRLLVTAFPDLELALRAINEEAIESFVVKPFNPEDLLETVFTILQQQRTEEVRDRAFARAMDRLRQVAGRPAR